MQMQQIQIMQQGYNFPQRQISDGFDVLVTLRGKSDHEVEFYVAPASLERPVRHVEEVVVGDPFVDHRP